MAYFSPKLYDVTVNGNLTWEFQPRKAQHFYALSNSWSKTMPWVNSTNSTDTHSDALTTYSSSTSNAGFSNVYVHTIVDWCTDTNYVYWPSESASVLHDTDKSRFTLNSSKTASIKLTPGIFSFSKSAAGTGYGDFERVLRSYTMDGTSDGGVDEFRDNFIGQMGGISPSTIYGPFVMFSVSAAIYSSIPNTITDGETFPATNIINGGVEDKKIYTIHAAEPVLEPNYFEQYASDIFSNTRLAYASLYGDEPHDDAQRIISEDDNFTRIVGPSSTFPRSKVGIFGTDRFDSVSNISLDAANNSSIYLLVKTVVRFYYNAYFNNGTRAPYYLNTSINAQSFPAKIISWEVWGPFRVLYTPSTITLETAYDFNGKTHLNYGDNGRVLGLQTVPVNNSSGNSFLGFSYDNLIRLKYTGTSFPIDVGYSPTVKNFNNGLIQFNDYTVNNTTQVVYQNFNVAPRLAIEFTESRDASIYVESFVDSTYHDMCIYNAYRVYVYPETAFNVSGTTISLTNNATPYNYSFDSSGNIVVDNVEVKNNSTNVLYLREVIEEKYIGSSNDVETTFVDYNSSFDGNSDITDVFTTTEVVESDVDKLQNISVSSYILNSTDEATPSQESILTTAENSLFSTSKLYSSNNVKIYKVSFDTSDLQNNSTETSLTVYFDNANVFTSGMKTLKINLTHSCVVSSIDASLAKAEDPNDPVGFIHIERSTMYIPWNASEYGSNTLLWISTTYTSSVSGEVPSNLLYDVEIDNLDSIYFNEYAGTGNFYGGQLGEVSVPLCIIGPGKTSVTITPQESVGDVSINFDLYVYTAVASIDVTGGLIYDTDGSTYIPSTNDTAIGIDDAVTLWSVPDEYHADTDNIPESPARKHWRRSGYRINYIFKDDEGHVVTDASTTNIANLTIKYSRSGFGILPITANQSLYFGATDTSEDITRSNVVTQPDNRLFNASPNLVPYNGIKTICFFPGDASNNNYPYPAGTTYLEPTVTIVLPNNAFGNSAVARPVKFKIRRTSTDITIVSSSAGPYYAGTPITFTVALTGEEPVSEWQLSAHAVGTSSIDVAVTVSNNQVSVVFPSNMSSSWSGNIVITANNHYGDSLMKNAFDDSITLDPIQISSINSTYYNSTSWGVVQTITSPNDATLTGVWYYSDTGMIRYFDGIVDPSTAINTKFDVSIEGNTSNFDRLLLYSTTGDYTGDYNGSHITQLDSNQRIGVRFANVKNSDPSTATQIKIYANGDITKYVTWNITPLMITDTISISNDDPSTHVYSPGEEFQVNIGINGNENINPASSTTSYPQFNVYEYIENEYVEILPEDIFNSISTSYDETNNRIVYTFTIKNDISQDTTVYIGASFTYNTDHPVDITVSPNDYIVINISHSDITGLDIYDESDSVISSTSRDVWYQNDPSTRFKFYGSVLPTHLASSLRTINYEIYTSDAYNIVLFEDGSNPTGIDSSSEVSLKFDTEKQNTSRSATCTIRATSVTASDVSTSFSVHPLKITSNVSANLSTSTITAGGSTTSTTLALTINGDETLTASSSITLQYKVGSGSYSTTVPDVIAVGTRTISNNSRTASYNISVGTVTSTTTVTIKAIVKNHENADISSNEVVLTVKPNETVYSISATVDKSVVYAREFAQITVQGGSQVTSFSVSSVSELEFETNPARSSWSTSLSGVAIGTKFYVRKKSSYVSSNISRDITVTAEQKDSTATQYDSTVVSISFGKITYTQSANYVYHEQNITLNAVFSPQRSDSIATSCWNFNNITARTFSNKNTTATITPAASIAAGAKTVTFTYSSGTYTFDSHDFSFTLLSAAEDYFYLEPSSRELIWLTQDINTTYTVKKGQNIVSIDSVSLDRAPVHLTNPVLNTSVNPNTVTISSNGDPGLGNTAEIRTFILTATKINGDTSTNSDAGEVTLRNGNSGHIFSSNPTSQTVDGDTGLSATYTITCNHKANGVTVDDRASVTASTTATWCNVSYNNGTLTVTTTSKCYKADRTAEITLSSSVDGHNPITVSFIQEYLRITPIFEIVNTSIFDSVSSTEADLVFKTAPATSEKTKQFQMNCGYIEKTKSGAEVGTTMGSGYSILSKSLGSWGDATTTTSGTKTVNVSVTGTNENTAANSGYFVLKTSYPTNVTTTNAQYRINVSQPGTVYNTFILTADGNSSDYTMTASSNNQSLTVQVVCKYNYVQDGITHTAENVSWDLNSSSLNWFTATKNGTNITIAVELNNGESGRSASMTISSTFDGRSTEKSITISFTQNAAKIEFDPASLPQLSPNASDIPSTDLKVATHNSSADWYIIPPASESFVTNVYDTNQASVVGNSNARKNDSSIRVTFNGDNMASGNTYVKYRSTTTDRSTSLTVRPVETENISSTINISQAGYSWTHVCIPSSSALSFNADDIEKTFTVTTNYDVDFSFSTSAVNMPDNPLSVEEYDLHENKFTNEEDNTIQKVFNCKFNMYCNPDSAEKSGSIIIKQITHGTEDSINDISIPFTQYGAGNNRSLDLKNDNESSSYDNGSIIEVTSLRTELACKVIAVLSGWTLTAGSDWIHIDNTSKDFSRQSISKTEETPVIITIDEYSNVDSSRDGTITLTSKENANLVKTFTIRQAKADLYFKLLGPYYAGGDADEYNDNPESLRAAFANINGFPNKTVYLMKDNEIIPHEGKTFKYYFEFYKGSARDGIGITTNAQPEETQITGTISNQIYSDNAGEKYCCSFTVTVTRNLKTSPRERMWISLTSYANSNIYITFTGNQEGNTYEAEGNVNFVVNSFIGQSVDGKYVIPVYGGNYKLVLHNELENDSIIIQNMEFTPGLEQNTDFPVGEEWGSISAEGNMTITASQNKTLDVIINPYTVNENNEVRPVSETESFKINTKYYGITITCYAASSPDKPYTFTLMHPNGLGALIAEQKSEDLTKTDSWELLSPLSINGEPQRVYCINDFVGVNTDKLYSMDTGITVKEQGTETYDDEIPEMQTIVKGLGGTAIDKRFGVR